ncbi:hypothetical protein FSO04_44275 [Paraburkholderia madseniana]|uniref:Uncharacterized protein n=1 Tax=Paraburkholderia madseniana TaxID=2599607 RepID=A0A6N6VZR6_9BURK|nr:hypothetical protein [Paraburkholderia madseniana]KAE8753601.1 hypothetical protein FSO04_44275 [Paraburkholderia madseniana]
MYRASSAMTPELAELLDACATFAPAAREQRIFMRFMVVPMLARKLDALRIALRAAPQRAFGQALIDQIARALSDACARLDLRSRLDQWRHRR